MHLGFCLENGKHISGQFPEALLLSVNCADTVQALALWPRCSMETYAAVVGTLFKGILQVGSEFYLLFYSFFIFLATVATDKLPTKYSKYG